MGDCVLTDIVERARELFVQAKLRGVVVERAAENGWYDKGTYITDFIPQAEIEALKKQEEANDE